MNQQQIIAWVYQKQFSCVSYHKQKRDKELEQCRQEIIKKSGLSELSSRVATHLQEAKNIINQWVSENNACEGVKIRYSDSELLLDPARCYQILKGYIELDTPELREIQKQYDDSAEATQQVFGTIIHTITELDSLKEIISFLEIAGFDVSELTLPDPRAVADTLDRRYLFPDEQDKEGSSIL